AERGHGSGSLQEGTARYAGHGRVSFRTEADRSENTTRDRAAAKGFRPGARSASKGALHEPSRCHGVMTRNVRPSGSRRVTKVGEGRGGGMGEGGEGGVLEGRGGMQRLDTVFSDALQKHIQVRHGETELQRIVQGIRSWPGNVRAVLDSEVDTVGRAAVMAVP